MCVHTHLWLLLQHLNLPLVVVPDDCPCSQLSSITQSCPALCDPMDCRTPGFLFITNSQSLLKLTSIKSVMPSNHLILCCPLLLLPSVLPAKGLFQWVGSLHQVTKVLEFQLQHQSIQWIIRTDFHYQCGTFCWLSLSLCYKTLFHESPTFLHILRTEVLIVLSF